METSTQADERATDSRDASSSSREALLPDLQATGMPDTRWPALHLKVNTPSACSVATRPLPTGRRPRPTRRTAVIVVAEPGPKEESTVPEAIKTAVMETVVKADTVNCIDMPATKVTTTIREGRRWHCEQRCDCESSKHRGTPGLSVTRLVGRRH